MKKWPAHGSSLISIHYRFEQSAEKKEYKIVVIVVTVDEKLI
jgi:hypothetical protein